MRNLFFLLITISLLILPTIAQSDEMAYVRIAHFSPDAETVDFYLNGQLLEADQVFPEVSGWTAYELGIYTLDIVPAGASLDETLLSEEYTLSADDWLTFALIGELNRETLQVQALHDNLGDIPDGETYIGVFHAIPDAPAVNVMLGDIELIRLLGYPGTFEGSDGYTATTLTAGSYPIEIRDQNDNPLVSIGETTLGVGRSYFIALVGAFADPQYILVSTDIEAITSTEADSLADVETGTGSLLARIGHFSISAGLIDIYLNDELLLEDAAFGDISDYLEFEAGIYDVRLTPAGGSPDEPLYQGQIALIADSLSLVAAIGFPENDSLTVVTALENNNPPPSGETRIAFFQALPSDQLFDLTANGNILIQGLAYPNIFEDAGDGYVSVDVVAGAYNFAVQSSVANINIGNITTGPGRVYLIIVTGTEVNPLYFLFSENFPE